MAGSQGIKASLLFVFWCRVPPGELLHNQQQPAFVS